MTPRPFRFAANAASAESREDWVGFARKIEAMGYDTLHIGEHPSAFALAPIAAMMAAADATTRLRIGTQTFINDFHHPVILAQEAATLDLLSDGRLELGIGAGWFLGDYTSTGMSFDAPAVRVGRLEEAVLLIKQLFAADPVTFSGNHYAVQDLNLRPKPLQSPHPPIFVGGGGKRLLSFAAREANIVSVIGKATRHGTMDIATREIDSFEQKLGWIRDAAGERFDTLELHTLVQEVVVTDDRRQSAEELIRWFDNFPPGVWDNPPHTAAQILDTPMFLVGTVEQIVDDLRVRRERFGISYLTINAHNVDAMASVVARLAGT